MPRQPSSASKRLGAGRVPAGVAGVREGRDCIVLVTGSRDDFSTIHGRAAWLLRGVQPLSYRSQMLRCLACLLMETQMRYSRNEHARVQALQQEVQRAEGDYQRLRAAYLEIAR